MVEITPGTQIGADGQRHPAGTQPTDAAPFAPTTLGELDERVDALEEGDVPPGQSAVASVAGIEPDVAGDVAKEALVAAIEAPGVIANLVQTNWDTPPVVGVAEFLDGSRLLMLEVQEFPAWQASHAYAVGDLVRKTTTTLPGNNGWDVWRVKVGGAGNSGVGEPDWDEALVDPFTVDDGTVTWEPLGEKWPTVRVPGADGDDTEVAGGSRLVVLGVEHPDGAPQGSFNVDGGGLRMFVMAGHSGLSLVFVPAVQNNGVNEWLPVGQGYLDVNRLLPNVDGDDGDILAFGKFGPSWEPPDAPPEPSVTIYVHDGDHYVLGTGRIFAGPEDPTADGFVMADGDLWEDTTP